MKRSSDFSGRTEPTSEIDLRALGAALKRRRRAIILPALFAFVLVTIFVNVVTPRYTAESSILLENQETSFTRPDRSTLQTDQATAFDAEAVASQVQLISSRDIARRAIQKLGLVGNSEFDPLANGLGPLTRVLILLGLVPDPTRESIDSRIVSKFLDKLAVYSPSKTRVITVQFTSRDADLAARAANTVAELYLQEQSAAKRSTAKLAAEALAAQITDLRAKLLSADDEREQYRLQSGLLAGSNNMTLSGQQLADINSDLSKARTTQADAQAKASMIEDLIHAGKEADVADVINNESVRRILEQRTQAQAQWARESRTLLPGHPRMKELSAQLAEYDYALKAAARQAAGSLTNEAKIAGQRVANLESVLKQQSKVAGVANTDEVHLRALERVAQSYKDQLESSTTKYQEALARQSSTATPADARVISGASRPQEPSYPKKLPFIVFGTIATLVFATGLVVASELLSGRVAFETDDAYVPVMPAKPPAVRPSAPREPAVPDAAPSSKPESATVADADPVFAPVASNPLSQPLPVKRTRTARFGRLAAAFSYLDAFGRSAAHSARAGSSDRLAPVVDGDHPDPKGSKADEPELALGVRSGLSGIVDRILEAHVPGRGLHIVGVGVDQAGGPPFLIELGRTLSGKGRTIIVDLNRVPDGLAPLAGTGDDGRRRIGVMHGLAELLAGDSSFAEVIQRDHGSRLHFVATGLQEADFHDFDLIIEALSETYDFIILMTPAFPHSAIAKIIAPYADFVVLSGTQDADADAVADLKGEMTVAGAKEVLVAEMAEPQDRKNVA